MKKIVLTVAAVLGVAACTPASNDAGNNATDINATETETGNDVNASIDDANAVSATDNALDSVGGAVSNTASDVGNVATDAGNAVSNAANDATH